MSNINSRVDVKDALSLKEFLRRGLGGTAKTLIPFVVMDDSGEKETHFTAICHQLHTVFCLKTETEKETTDAVEMFTGLEIHIIEGISERVG